MGTCTQNGVRTRTLGYWEEAGALGEGSATRLLTRHTYWLWGPGEKVLERMMVLPRRNGPGDGAPTRRSLGRTTVGDGAGVSVLVSLST